MQTCLLKIFLLVLFMASCSWKCFLKAGLMDLGFGIAEHMVGCKVPSLGNHHRCHSWLSTMCVSPSQHYQQQVLVILQRKSAMAPPCKYYAANS